MQPNYGPITLSSVDIAMDVNAPGAVIVKTLGVYNPATEKIEGTVITCPSADWDGTPLTGLKTIYAFAGPFVEGVHPFDGWDHASLLAINGAPYGRQTFGNESEVVPGGDIPVLWGTLAPAGGTQGFAYFASD